MLVTSFPSWSVTFVTYAPSDENASPTGYVYSYGLSDNYVLGSNAKVEYQLTGACDSVADWSGIETDVLSADIVWTVTADELTPPEPDPAAPSIAVDSFDYSAASGAEILVDLGDGNLAATGIASVTWANTSDGSFAAIGGYDTPDFDTETSTLTLPSGLFGGCAVGGTRAIKITFNDDANTSVILTLTKTN